MAAHDIVMAAAGAASGPANYIEDVFSTYLYTGNNTSQTITNGIDLSTKGGMTLIKARSSAELPWLFDTARGTSGTYNYIGTGTSSVYSFPGYGVTAFNSNGFTVNGPTGYAVNSSGVNYASWTFRKQPKFFDIQTFSTTTEPTSPRTISHNLGSTPGFVIVKNTSLGSDWYVYHRSTGDNAYMVLNTTQASGSLTGAWAVTDTTITIKENFLAANSAFVVYIYAHNAGGFGLTGTDNVISCGSFTDTEPTAVNLGWEPQWLLIKNTQNAEGWYLFDSMRGIVTGGGYLFANASNAEATWGGAGKTILQPNGFSIDWLGAANTYIYIAIRRGPMKVPTDATKVFIPVANTVSADNTVATTNFPVDLVMSKVRTTLERWWWFDRLRGSKATGPSKNLSSNAAYAEGTIASNGYGLDSNTTFVDNFQYFWNGTSRTFINYAFRRAPSFFDVVCYTGTGAAHTIPHNLGVAPELIFAKCRTSVPPVTNWRVYSKTLGPTRYLELNNSGIGSTWSDWNSTSPTSSVFSVGADGSYDPTNYNGQPFVAYLFATCPGVSKVGSYSGNNSSQTINCGFTGGARFVLIKRVDTNGPWMVWDTARGMVAGTDYNMFINTDDAQENANNVYTATTGFQVIAFGSQDVNLTGGTYIYLAIA